jgi:RimJ/RimL family protein N-acetyltransferase
MPLPELQGNLIRLRSLRRSDAASIQWHADNRKISRNVPLLPNPYTLKDAQRWIRTSQRLSRTGQGYNFGIVDNELGSVVGCIGLKNINLHDKNAEVGYWLGERFWGKGYVSEALSLVVGFVFGQLRLRRVYAIVHASNRGSIKVLERAGFKREGTFRKACLMSGRWTDVYAYGLLKEEFRR